MSRRSVFEFKAEYYEIRRSATDACWSFTMAIDSDYPTPSMYEPLEMVIEDSGTEYCLLIGFSTKSTFITQDNRIYNELSGFSYGWYVQNAPILKADRLLKSTTSGTTIIIEDPLTYSDRLIFAAGTNPRGLIKGGMSASTPGWGTTVAYKQFESNYNSTLQSVIDDMGNYAGLLSYDRWKKIGSIWYPAYYHVSDADMDTLMDLPNPIIIENTSDSIRLNRMVKDASIDNDATKQYTRVYVDSVVDGTESGYYAVIPATWNVSTQGPERAYQDCFTLPPTLTAAEAQTKTNQRAQTLYNLLSAPTHVYDVEFLGRYDIQLFQRIQFVGFPKLPDDMMRIIDITHRKDYKGFQTSVRCAVDRQWSAARALGVILADNDWSKFATQIMDSIEKKQKSNYTGTAIAYGPRGTVIARTSSGALVYQATFNM
jgi:hypothetical protein